MCSRRRGCRKEFRRYAPLSDHPLHRADANAEGLRDLDLDLAHALAAELGDPRFNLSRYRRSAELLALRPGAFQPYLDLLLNHRHGWMIREID